MECRWRENVPKAKEHVQFSICAFRTHTAHTQTFTAMEFIFLFQSHSLTPLPLIRHKFFITSLIRLHAKRAAVAFFVWKFWFAGAFNIDLHRGACSSFFCPQRWILLYGATTEQKEITKTWALNERETNVEGELKTSIALAKYQQRRKTT